MRPIKSHVLYYERHRDRHTDKLIYSYNQHTFLVPRYKLFLPYDGNWGAMTSNGSFNGMVGMVQSHVSSLSSSRGKGSRKGGDGRGRVNERQRARG